MSHTRKYGICPVSCLPLRAAPDEKSEMVSMLLFGELFEVRKTEQGWYQVCTEYDGYCGWLSGSVVHFISGEEYTCHAAECKTLIKPEFIIPEEYPDYPFMILPGSSLPPFSGNSFILAGKIFRHGGTLVINEGKVNPLLQVTETALMFLNAPYLWGGRSLFGVDCSGFVQVVFKTAGIRLPRDASQQAHMGEPISFREARSGDIAFFGPSPEKITHTGIFLGPGRFIHASGKVRIDSIDEKGIFSEETKQNTHTLQLTKRLIF
ncbi:MAG: C40 family peptidase [Bacteroidales bacterium]|nr:C40 family peptidase [Bacteroidales bacterium]